MPDYVRTAHHFQLFTMPFLANFACHLARVFAAQSHTSFWLRISPLKLNPISCRRRFLARTSCTQQKSRNLTLILLSSKQVRCEWMKQCAERLECLTDRKQVNFLFENTRFCWERNIVLEESFYSQSSKFNIFHTKILVDGWFCFPSSAN